MSMKMWSFIVCSQKHETWRTSVTFAAAGLNCILASYTVSQLDWRGKNHFFPLKFEKVKLCE